MDVSHPKRQQHNLLNLTGVQVQALRSATIASSEAQEQSCSWIWLKKKDPIGNTQRRRLTTRWVLVEGRTSGGVVGLSTRHMKLGAHLMAQMRLVEPYPLNNPGKCGFIRETVTSSPLMLTLLYFG